MLSIPPTTKLWYGGAVDLRLGFDGLYRHVQAALKADPVSGHLFLFTNRSANRINEALSSAVLESMSCFASCWV